MNGNIITPRETSGFFLSLGNVVEFSHTRMLNGTHIARITNQIEVYNRLQPGLYEMLIVEYDRLSGDTMFNLTRDFLLYDPNIDLITQET